MICILGGTFDPVHYGHLRTAIEVREALGIKQIHLLPCLMPPHRPRPVATPRQRLALLKLSIADEPALAIDDRELRREGPSYMVDTLGSIREQAGDEAVCLILGMDAFQGLDSWREWRSIIKLAHLVLLHRPGSIWPDKGELAELVKEARVKDVEKLQSQPAGLVYSVPVTQLDISSTRIRELLSTGISSRFLLPDSVLDRITREGWYASKADYAS